MASWNYPWDNTGVTVELRDIIESGVDIWKFDYPSYYKGAEKTAFEQKVIDHYFLRQIGQETVGRWLHHFRTRMREIMPYYIQLYESQALMQSIDDPFGNIDLVETFEQETTGTTITDSESTHTGSTTGAGSETRTNHAEQGQTKTTDAVRKFSNTPQGSIDNLENYMTEATVDTADEVITADTDGRDSLTKEDSVESEDKATGKTTGTDRGTVKHTITKKGNQGVNTYAHDMKELRETFLNIDLMIIRELNDLFLMVY